MNKKNDISISIINMGMYGNHIRIKFCEPGQGFWEDEVMPRLVMTSVCKADQVTLNFGEVLVMLWLKCWTMTS